MCTKSEIDEKFIKEENTSFSQIIEELKKFKESDSYYVMAVKFNENEMTSMQSVNHVSLKAIEFAIGKVLESLKNREGIE